VATRYPGYHRCIPWARRCSAKAKVDALVPKAFTGNILVLHEHTGDQLWRGRAQEYSLRPGAEALLIAKSTTLAFSFFRRIALVPPDRRTGGARCLNRRWADASAAARKGRLFENRSSGPQSLFIDIMMNVGIHLLGARETKRCHPATIALEHCRTTASTWFRPDGEHRSRGDF